MTEASQAPRSRSSSSIIIVVAELDDQSSTGLAASLTHRIFNTQSGIRNCHFCHPENNPRPTFSSPATAQIAGSQRPAFSRGYPPFQSLVGGSAGSVLICWTQFCGSIGMCRDRSSWYPQECSCNPNLVAMEDPPPYEEVSHCRVCNCTFTTFKRRVRSSTPAVVAAAFGFRTCTDPDSGFPASLSRLWAKPLQWALLESEGRVATRVLRIKWLILWWGDWFWQSSNGVQALPQFGIYTPVRVCDDCMKPPKYVCEHFGWVLALFQLLLWRNSFVLSKLIDFVCQG